MTGHDPDTCPFCLDNRALRLLRRGVSRRVVRQLRAAQSLAEIRVLEQATPEQIAALNREAAR